MILKVVIPLTLNPISVHAKFVVFLLFLRWAISEHDGGVELGLYRDGVDRDGSLW